MIKLLLLFSTFSAFSLSATETCDQKTVSKVEYMQCLDQQLEQSKRELTTWENNHLFKLEEQASSTGRQDGLKLFNKARQTFALYTEQDCRWQFILQLPDNKTASAVYKECQLYHFKQRIELLKQVHTKPE
ncbi:MAG: DUF1311 domain-containing protein [Gammaproteobacteria bacterium]|nr:DUF1311 domain-containing protein [Gammaproteobacteria bacterium]MBU2056193.1 DUF1311 domain-containing protein [Gammaproteobacteria bacterium]MBU2176942.1 DUF1311 domain-containing protein [Gammaproteobacteria bacterium]MBU2248950.1 DUF1311 domain-containing protein [Gammaproteobacteria bacterium]MBU2344892.1 DUF1311 domain-containing protein [Gammaproteobacteria bacterium]